MVKPIMPLALLAAMFTFCGCQGPVRTFAGFTFGGGGNTFHCEPATWQAGSDTFELVSGSSGPTSLRIRGTSTAELGQPLDLSEAEVRVPTHSDTASLVPGGHLVLQSQEDSIVHGSFDLKAKLPDGRVFPVVGSFTAERRLP